MENESQISQLRYSYTIKIAKLYEISNLYCRKWTNSIPFDLVLKIFLSTLSCIMHNVTGRVPFNKKNEENMSLRLSKSLLKNLSKKICQKVCPKIFKSTCQKFFQYLKICQKISPKNFSINLFQPLLQRIYRALAVFRLRID